MGFLDSIVALFNGDIFCPDNPKRARRFQELEWDCNEFIRQNKTLSSELEHSIAQLDECLREAFHEVLQRPAPLQPMVMIVLPVPYQPLPELFSPLLISSLQESCQLTAELGCGVNLVQLSSLLGLSVIPTGDNWVFGIPRDLITFDPRAGIRNRENLRRAIRDSKVARHRVRSMLAATTILHKAVQAVQMSFNSLHGIVDEPALLESLAQQIRALRNEIDALDEETCQWLYDYDCARGSWMEEG